MLNPIGRNWRVPVQSAFLGGLLLVGVSGCETVEVAEEPPEVIQPIDPEPATPPPEPEPETGGILVRLHAKSDAEMPDGATATVTLERQGATHSVTMSKGERLAQFDAVEQGRYDLRVAVRSDGVEIGDFSYFVNVGDVMGDVTVQIDYLRADLVVEATVERSLERRYIGTATTPANDCPGSQPSQTVPSDLRLTTDGDELQLTIANFQQETLQLSGRFLPEAPPLAATGTFTSSSGQSGGWELLQLAAPTRATIAAALMFSDQQRSCRWSLEYAGLREDANDFKALASNEADAMVEVTGHGQTLTQTLGRREPNARFDGLLVGPYQVLVGLRDRGQTVNRRRESVMLTPEGARVESTFATEWTLPPSKPLADGEGHALLGHAFQGKSVVTAGTPECAGSIPLVDTAKLTISAGSNPLEMTFDNFYGKVLALNGRTEAPSSRLPTSGRYQSSDGKAGSWTLTDLAAPSSQSVAMQVAFSNETDSCEATYGFAGVR